MSTNTTPITIHTKINAPIGKIWHYWSLPEHIINWNYASDDWHCPKAENNLIVGGELCATMAAKDGSFSFDFSAKHTEIVHHKMIASTMSDGRQMKVEFSSEENVTIVTETFEPETENPIEMQQQGWQAILNNFKKYAEGLQPVKLHFNITINASVGKVYATMLEDKTYREWVAIFNPSSYYEGKWETGAKMLFVGISETGEKGGMVSKIIEAKNNEFVSIQHLGLVEGDNEITEGPKVEGWAGAMENYTFKPLENGTLLEVEMDANNDFKDYFESTWPSALNKLKEICER